jgi:hypothetical protein
VSAETADPYAGAVPVALVASRPLGKEPGTVLRRSLLAVPLVAVLAALAGAALAARPVLAVVLAGSGGLAVAALVARAGERGEHRDERDGEQRAAQHGSWFLAEGA